MTLSCARCKNEISTLQGVAYEIKGWEQPREQGGTNHVLWRNRTGRVMCPMCVVEGRLGIDREQLTLT